MNWSQVFSESSLRVQGDFMAYPSMLLYAREAKCVCDLHQAHSILAWTGKLRSTISVTKCELSTYRKILFVGKDQ